MKVDPIIAEVRRIKDELAAKFNYDIEAMVRDAQKRQWESGHRIVRAPARRKRAA